MSSEKAPAPDPDSGTVFNIQRFSIEDGPGIRTTVFMKGCPLRCTWCHNPEGLVLKPQLMWFDVRCIGARDCLAACTRDALELTRDGMRIDREACDTCGDCAKACPAGALEVVGRSYTPDEAYEEVYRDEAFYRNSGGGMTVSGGEPTMQPRFVAALLRKCREGGIHTALDTCGYSSPEVLTGLLELADMALLDLKVMDEAEHRRLTGVDPAPVLDSARILAGSGKPVWVRTPIIPGCTDSPENIAALASFLAGLGGVQRWDLLAFNNTCGSKYSRLDMVWELEGVPLKTEDEMVELAGIAERSGVEKVAWSGVTRHE
ncbi:MAG: glycyl-radical enzyme activating protein [Actinobacteria bacterium]|nr:glycyl-radical enzyme activating protein [Actinomycetota bacterium]MBU1943535.1 glycyl-radical enzyme activating protein [Actinomycetota bacterium]MBU2687544.1 glycyl-radical enzyme activating protein [Actinomycetota bacterium]